MKEIIPGIYQIEVPLPGSPLKILNSYLVKGPDKHLLIDVGYNTDAGEETLRRAFDQLGIRFEDTDIFLTHLHGDHSGLIDRLFEICPKIYVSEFDGNDINQNSNDDYWQEIMSAQVRMGTPKDKMLAPSDHPGYTGGTRNRIDFVYVEDGDLLQAGDYSLEVVDLKGHTPGQKGLYEKKHKILFCGDHILSKITPNITTWDFKEDYLGLFLKSLDKVAKMDIELLLPGHRALITDHRSRIGELAAHHEKRLARIRVLLRDGEKTVYELAHGIKWDFGTSNYADFPNEQKWFAGSEVYAHVEHLKATGQVAYDERDGVLYIRLV